MFSIVGLAKTRPTANTLSLQLHRVIALLLINLALITVTTALTVVFRDSVVTYQLAQLPMLHGNELEAARSLLTKAIWLRVGVTAFAAIVYIWLISRLRRGSRWAYLRVIWISVVGLAAVGYLAVDRTYPLWSSIAQLLQAAVLAAMLWTTTRPALRMRYTRTRRAPDHGESSKRNDQAADPH